MSETQEDTSEVLSETTQWTSGEGSSLESSPTESVKRVFYERLRSIRMQQDVPDPYHVARPSRANPGAPPPLGPTTRRSAEGGQRCSPLAMDPANLANQQQGKALTETRVTAPVTMGPANLANQQQSVASPGPLEADSLPRSSVGAGASTGDSSAFPLPTQRPNIMTQGELRVLLFQMCKRCQAYARARIGERSYQVLTQLTPCPRCDVEAIRNAFHLICEPCAGVYNICARCGLDHPEDKVFYTEDTNASEAQLDIALGNLAQGPRKQVDKYRLSLMRDNIHVLHPRAFYGKLSEKVRRLGGGTQKN